jgi:hypothetical protein
MKQIPIIVFFLLLAKTIYSQPFGDAMPAFSIIKLHYENSSGAIETTDFHYDKQNKLSKAIWSLHDHSRSSTNYYEYDSKGNLIAAYRDFSDGLTSFERFNYDTLGNKVSEYFYRSDSISGSASHIYNKNQLIQSNFIKHKGWLSGNLEFQYNNKNKKEKGILWKDNHVIGEVQYSYDSIGNLIREFWDFNGEWSQTFHFTYRKIEQPAQFYSSPFLSGKSNFRISQENYTFNDEMGGPSIYYYNEQNLLIRKDYIRSDSLRTNTFYEYDNEGKLVDSKRIYSDSLMDRFTYIYDENKNLVFRNCFRADTLYGFESYLYNSEDVLVKAYLKNFEGWLNGTINFKSDEFGKIEAGEFTGQDGFNASIIFHYNLENLISKIKWTFTFGKLQEYSFEYECINSPSVGGAL